MLFTAAPPPYGVSATYTPLAVANVLRHTICLGMPRDARSPGPGPNLKSPVNPLSGITRTGIRKDTQAAVAREVAMRLGAPEGADHALALGSPGPVLVVVGHQMVERCRCECYVVRQTFFTVRTGC